ncbi:hypothetical protein [Desulfobulbus alkaliphilus]|uniref:hypothetical protein n=1 Tax=Desulfobulbus alkaliphilus TaxID=869814 RepID=UPI001962AC5F|nr:hypothetical protein [Desulfobulbus alkaliphilus]MBM9538175.1 hypothetical protein [Desulfobulbus alkaliphilus]
MDHYCRQFRHLMLLVLRLILCIGCGCSLLLLAWSTEAPARPTKKKTALIEVTSEQGARIEAWMSLQP